MREFQFTYKEDQSVQISVMVDIIDPKTQLFTIVDMKGDEWNIDFFKKYFGWHEGSILHRTDIEEWYKEFSNLFIGIEYGGLDCPKEMDSGILLVPTPSIDLDGVVSMYNPNSKGKIYYTTDGSIPTEESTLYEEPITLTNTTTLKIAVIDGDKMSETVEVTYEKANINASHAANYATGKDIVTYSTTTPNGEIHYTTDGSNPTSSSPSASFVETNLYGDVKTVKAIVFAQGYIPSVLSTVTIGLEKPTSPSISVSPSGLVTITKNDETVSNGGIVYYTTDGSTPTSSSAEYNSAFQLNYGATIKAIVVCYTDYSSNVVTLNVNSSTVYCSVNNDNYGNLTIDGSPALQNGNKIFYTGFSKFVEIVAIAESGYDLQKWQESFDSGSTWIDTANTNTTIELEVGNGYSYYLRAVFEEAAALPYFCVNLNSDDHGLNSGFYIYASLEDPESGSQIEVDLEYSFDAVNWNELPIIDGETRHFNSENESVVYLRGHNEYVEFNGYDTYWGFATEGDIPVSLSGDITSIINGIGGDCYLNQNIFAGFFYNANIDSVPNLPSTNLSTGCYSRMFADCIHITESPLLPARTVPEGAYRGMFYGCSSLSSIYCRATYIGGNPYDDSYGTYDWVYGIANEGNFYGIDSSAFHTYSELYDDMHDGIPYGWNFELLPLSNAYTFTLFDLSATNINYIDVLASYAINDIDITTANGFDISYGTIPHEYNSGGLAVKSINDRVILLTTPAQVSGYITVFRGDQVGNYQIWEEVTLDDDVTEVLVVTRH